MDFLNIKDYCVGDRVVDFANREATVIHVDYDEKYLVIRFDLLPVRNFKKLYEDGEVCQFSKI